MSGSYDRPTGRPPEAPRRNRELDPYDDYVTGYPTGPTTAPPLPHEIYGPGAYGPVSGYESDQHHAADAVRRAALEHTPRGDMIAPARDARREGDRVSAPIVPAGSVTGQSLTLVVTIMCFLACLTAGTVYMIRQSADAWLKDIASEVTVQIEAKEKVDTDGLVKEVAAFLGRQPGVASVKPLSVDESAELLEPWLGKVDALKALPVPRLIAIELDRTSPPNLDAVRAELERQFAGASLDDHRRWQQQIRTITGSFALGGLGILLLVAAATTAIIVSATKSAMASNREIVEVLHFVGATDRFIAREFEKHFLRLGIRAGLVGALLALAVFLAMPVFMELLGGGTLTVAELHRLVGTGTLDVAGSVLLGIVVVVVAALCMLTSRFGVFRILKGKH
jgi:cell division transport system permease protein